MRIRNIIQATLIIKLYLNTKSNSMFLSAIDIYIQYSLEIEYSFSNFILNLSQAFFL